MGNVTIDDDDLSDEYDFMDEDEDHEQRRREKARSRVPHHKYKDMLQDLADRKIDEVKIDLDDVDNVFA